MLNTYRYRMSHSILWSKYNTELKEDMKISQTFGSFSLYDTMYIYDMMYYEVGMNFGKLQMRKNMLSVISVRSTVKQVLLEL